jgi:hypothetical protein
VKISVKESYYKQWTFVTGQRSNQLNYVPNRGINNLAQNLANKAFARFAYGALAALDAVLSLAKSVAATMFKLIGGRSLGERQG